MLNLSCHDSVKEWVGGVTFRSRLLLWKKCIDLWALQSTVWSVGLLVGVVGVALFSGKFIIVAMMLKVFAWLMWFLLGLVLHG